MATTAKQTATKPKPKPKPKKKTYADYGYVKAFLDQHKDVKALVDKAIKEGWTPDRLEGEIRNTKWWKTRNDSQRKWDLLSAEQPAEKERLLTNKMDELRSLAKSLGIDNDVTDWELRQMAAASLRDGKSDTEVRLMLANNFVLDADQTESGTAGTTIDSIRKQAAEYGVTVSDQRLTQWTQRALAGDLDPASLEDVFREQAKALYPPLADILDKGQTVAGFVSPYLEIASKQLGITSDQMDLTDTKWMGMIQDGAILDADSWARKIRSDSTYGWKQTDGAKREAMNLVSTLGAIFGGA